MRDDFKTRAEFIPNRRITLGGDYKYSRFNDSNNRNAYGLDAKATVLYEPTSLRVMYRYEAYGFEEARGYYFSPDSFHTNMLDVEFRHFLNKEEMFWGANDTYYTLKYSLNVDVHSQIGHKIYVDFHREWTKCLSTHVEWSKMLYDHLETYAEENLFIYVKCYF
jgi:hypothetical protein